MKKSIFSFVALASFFTLNAQTKTTIVSKVVTPVKKSVATKPVASTSLSFKNTKDSASYALGYRIAQSLKGQGLQDVNFEMFKKGMAAGVASKTEIPDSLIDVCIKNYQDKMSQEKSQ